MLEETEETKLTLDGNGAKLRRHKLHDSTPEHVDFTVTERGGWQEHARPHLVKVDRRRAPFEDYRKARALAAETQRFFCWGGVGPFEQMHPVCGHEHMLMGMALDPDWVIDMATSTFQRRCLRRPAIELELFRCRRSAWQLFARHHYLSGGLSAFARCFLALWEGNPVAFVATLPLMGRKNRRRFSRIVTLPDYQGIGIGMAVAEAVAEASLEP